MKNKDDTLVIHAFLGIVTILGLYFLYAGLREDEPIGLIMGTVLLVGATYPWLKRLTEN